MLFVLLSQNRWVYSTSSNENPGKVYLVNFNFYNSFKVRNFPVLDSIPVLELFKNFEKGPLHEIIVVKVATQTQFKACITAFTSIDFMKRTFLKVLIISSKTGIDSSFSFVNKSVRRAKLNTLLHH